MAKKEKTSFFGKIMGGNVTDDSAQMHTVSQLQEQAPAEELASDDDAAEDQEMIIEEEEEIVLPAQPLEKTPKQQAVSEAKEGNEEWLNDFEGQLNIDMYQTKDNVIIKSTIAGVRPEDIDITVANDMVTIRGARRKDESVPQDDYFYQECYWGNFSRSVIIPVDIESEEIEADLKDGILTVIIPKAAKAKTKKVKVKGL
jgi:HSP20 family protein